MNCLSDAVFNAQSFDSLNYLLHCHQSIFEPPSAKIRFEVIIFPFMYVHLEGTSNENSAASVI